MLPNKIVNDYCLKPYKNNWFKGVIDLEDRVFFHFMKEDKEEKRVFSTTMLNFNKTKVIDEFLRTIDGRMEEQEISFDRITKVPLLKINSFDHVIFAPFCYTLIPNSDFPDFDKRLIYVYPIYDFEVSGDESMLDMKSITRRVLSTVEWNREPSPLVRYKFTNPKHQYGTAGKGLIIDKEANVYAALKNFESNDCVMEVQNSKKDNLKITFEKKTSSFNLAGNKITTLKFDKTQKYLENFFRKSKGTTSEST